jgi:tetrahydromethanopterin S-methyltransferase subunit G
MDLSNGVIACSLVELAMMQGMGSLSPDNMTLKILETLGDIKAAMSGIGSDVSYLRKRVDDLWTKVDEIERTKATKSDLQALEIRTEKTIAGMKAQTAIDLAKIEHDKIGHDQFSVDSFDSVSERLDDIEKKIDSLMTLKSKVIGGAAVLVALGSVLGWLLSFVFKH